MSKINLIYNKIKQYVNWVRRLWHPFCKTAYLLATPTHNNIGDLAIVVAEERFLTECGYEKVVNITIGDCWEYMNCIARLLPKNAPIYLHGGGNMGDIYEDEKLRRKLIPLLKRHEIILFPETIFYRKSNNGVQEEKKSVAFYNSKNITIAAREQVSYEIMKELYPKANIVLTPDIVFAMGIQKFEKKRRGILLCFRNDQEKEISDESIHKLKGVLDERGYDISITSMIYDRHIVAGMWEIVVREKMEQIASSKLLITDRLHGMIFAAITQTPCIVFGNNHHKISGVYKWIENLDYIRFVSTIDDAVSLVDKLYSKKECKFDFNNDFFNQFKRLISKKVD